jgi:hypothetical protein
LPYWLETDAFADDPIWQVLGAGKADVEDRLQAAYCRLKAKTSHLRDNGYLTTATALAQCRGRRQVLDLLCTSVLERPPLLHRQGDTCPCLGGEWIEGFGYRVHEFLKRNPSRAEHDRAKAQRADLRNARLKALVYERDAGCCRYCRSGPLSNKAGRSRDRRKALVYDHVDPDAPAGEDGATSSPAAPPATSTRATARRTRRTWCCCRRPRTPSVPRGVTGRCSCRSGPSTTPPSWPAQPMPTPSARSPTDHRPITNKTLIVSVIRTLIRAVILSVIRTVARRHRHA